MSREYINIYVYKNKRSDNPEKSVVLNRGELNEVNVTNLDRGNRKRKKGLLLCCKCMYVYFGFNNNWVCVNFAIPRQWCKKRGKKRARKFIEIFIWPPLRSREHFEFFFFFFSFFCFANKVNGLIKENVPTFDSRLNIVI